MKSATVDGPERKQTSFLAPIEKAILSRLAERMPAWVSPDHLSLIGFIGMFLAGLFYYFSKWNPLFLHLVNLSLTINWFGDSLDGTLARYRNKQRPKYGFYVDHIIDTFGAFFLISGLALSNYITERIACGMLVAFLMLAINSYLAAYSLGTFSLSYWKFSPTEIRLLLGIGNIALVYHPYSRILGETYLLYDMGGIVSIVGMSIMLVISAIRNIQILYRSERI